MFPVTLAILGGTIGSGEMFIVFVAALLLFGAKRLPDLARMLGRMTSQLRRASEDFRDQIVQAGNEAAEDAEPEAEPPDGMPPPALPEVYDRASTDTEPPAAPEVAEEPGPDGRHAG